MLPVYIKINILYLFDTQTQCKLVLFYGWSATAILTSRSRNVIWVSNLNNMSNPENFVLHSTACYYGTNFFLNVSIISIWFVFRKWYLSFFKTIIICKTLKPQKTYHNNDNYGSITISLVAIVYLGLVYSTVHKKEAPIPSRSTWPVLLTVPYPKLRKKIVLCSKVPYYNFRVIKFQLYWVLGIIRYILQGELKVFNIILGNYVITCCDIQQLSIQ